MEWTQLKGIFFNVLTAWFNLLSVQCFSVCVRRRLWWRGAIGTSLGLYLRGIDGARGAFCLCRFLSAVKINGVLLVVRESSLLSLHRPRTLSTSTNSLATSRKGIESVFAFWIRDQSCFLFFANHEILKRFALDWFLLVSSLNDWMHSNTCKGLTSRLC